ncbi:MAG: saccharopine dehydrogenase NADP-binding domain-containing protein [Alphaproteobacteria bacterium]
MSDATKVLMLGVGKIGSAITDLLHGSGNYDVTVADYDKDALSRIHQDDVKREVLDVSDAAALTRAMTDRDVVVSALPYYLNQGVIGAARQTSTHYFDLTEDIDTTDRLRRIAEEADVVFVPHCGLAPGFIQIAAYELTGGFDSLRSVHMRVGALPQFPTNDLMYNLTWSTDGLINEYCNPCEVIHNGVRQRVLPLDGLETFSLDGVSYECFNTSGGLGTLCETLEGKVESLNYKTVRYHGHRELARFLTRDLRLGERRQLFKEVLEAAIPITEQDVVLVFATVTGLKEGLLNQQSLARKIYSQEIGGRTYSAIQITTAAGLCAMVDLLREGRLPQQGFVRQEDADYKTFIENRFGRVFA